MEGRKERIWDRGRWVARTPRRRIPRRAYGIGIVRWRGQEGADPVNRPFEQSKVKRYASEMGECILLEDGTRNRT